VQSQFDTLFSKVSELRKNYQLTNQNVVSKMQKYITKEEWGDIRL
jgi:hypothetical protein